MSACRKLCLPMHRMCESADGIHSKTTVPLSRVQWDGLRELSSQIGGRSEKFFGQYQHCNLGLPILFRHGNSMGKIVMPNKTTKKDSKLPPIRLERLHVDVSQDDAFLLKCPIRRLADFSERERADILLRLVHRMSPEAMLARGANPKQSRPWLTRRRAKR